MTLEQNLNNAFTRIATEFKQVAARQGSLANLTTTEKSSLVGALNELKTLIGAAINDYQTGTSSTYSAAKIDQKIAQAKSEIIGGAGAAFDTLKEIADLLAGEDNAISALNTAIANRLRFDGAQSLTGPQKAQALTNIGAVSLSDIGDTSANFVAVFEAALT